MFSFILNRRAVIALTSILLIEVGAKQTSAQSTSSVERVSAPRAELVRNGDLEGGTLSGWTLVEEGGGKGELAADSTVRSNETNSHSLRLTVKNPGSRCGVSNSGIAGMNVKGGTWYELRFHAYSSKRENDRGYGLTVSLEGKRGRKLCARATLPEVGGEWKEYTLALNAYDADSNARMIITMSEPGTIWLDQISLTPREPNTARPGEQWP